MPSILLINPNTSAASTEMMLSIARPLLPTGVILRGRCAERGAAMIVDEDALAAAADEVVRITMDEACAHAGVIVAAFGDPAVQRLRRRLSIPIVGIGEAAIHEAAADGRRFGIATTTPKLVRSIERLVRETGLAAGFTGVRLSAGDPLALAAAADDQEAALADAAIACIERDGAEAVIIGGGPLGAAAARLRRRLAATIVEPVPAAVRRVLTRTAELRDGSAARS